MDRLTSDFSNLMEKREKTMNDVCAKGSNDAVPDGTMMLCGCAAK